MSKDLPYFKMYVAEFLLGRISTEKDEIIGIFTLVCCHYWHKECSISLQELEKKLSKSRIKKLISSDFLLVNDGEVSIPFLDEQYYERSKTHNVNVKNGLIGAEKRWSKKNSEANGEAIALRGDKEENKKRGEDNKIQIPTESEFLEYCKTFLNGTYHEYEFSLKAKYEAWKDAGWVDGRGKKIKIWKTTIKNTVPYLKKFNTNGNDKTNIKADAGTGYGRL